MSIITKEKFTELYQQMPENLRTKHSPKEFAESLLNKGHKLEGYDVGLSPSQPVAQQAAQSIDQPEEEKNIFQKAASGISESFKAGQERMVKGAELISDYGKAPKEAEEKGIGNIRQKIVGAGEAALGSLEVLASPVLGLVGTAVKDIGGNARKNIVNQIYQGQLEAGKTPDEAVAETERQIGEVKQSIAKQIEPIKRFLEKYPEVGQAIELGLWLMGGGQGKAAAETSEQALKTVGETGLKIGSEIGEQSSKTIVSAGEALSESAKKSFLKQAEEIVVPKLEELTSRERGSVAKSISENRLGSRSIIPNNRQQVAAEQIAQMIENGKINQKSSTLKQLNSVNDEISNLATSLENDLKTNPSGKMTQDTFNSVLDDVQDALKENITITGDAEKSVQKLIQNAKKQAEGLETIDSLDLLRIRRGIDNFVKSQKGEGIFDPKTENALSIALRELRQTLNDQAASLAPASEIKQSLAKQSALFDAMNVIENRFRKESTNWFGRILSDVPILNKLPKSEIVETIGFGIPALGATFAGAPFLATILGTGFVFKKGVGWILQPKFRNALGKLLKKVGKSEKSDSLQILKDLQSGKAISENIISAQ